MEEEARDWGSSRLKFDNEETLPPGNINKFVNVANIQKTPAIQTWRSSARLSSSTPCEIDFSKRD